MVSLICNTDNKEATPRSLFVTLLFLWDNLLCIRFSMSPSYPAIFHSKVQPHSFEQFARNIAELRKRFLPKEHKVYIHAYQGWHWMNRVDSGWTGMLKGGYRAWKLCFCSRGKEHLLMPYYNHWPSSSKKKTYTPGSSKIAG